MRCPNCRSHIEKKDLYCTSCGYYIPSYKKTKIHPYAKKSNLPFISFLTASISLVGSYVVSYYFFILAIIGFMIGFYSLLKYRRGIFGIIFNIFALVLAIFLILNPNLFYPGEPSVDYKDYFTPYYGSYECSSDKIHNDLYLELNSDYSFQYLEKIDQADYYSYGTFSYTNKTENLESADHYQFEVFLKAPKNQYFINDVLVHELFQESGIFTFYGDQNISGTIAFSSSSLIYFCKKIY